VAQEFDWRPITELLEQIHDGDPEMRRDRPSKWWGLEPLNQRRHNRQLRYASVFHVNSDN
jgi:hypothetical protein